ncbi:MAG: FtsX-like permease family protein, partial [Erysipelotrichaceae bacterium]|nr:FtsX-like permease family protein [Erysipelotrichaceae bacterium]
SLRSNKVLAFFVGFSAFCFSAMLQMAISMNELASESFAGMMLLIGLILAFMTLFLALSSLMKGNQKTMAMMRVMGYNERECAYTILHVYRPISYIGFLIGTLYQYLLLKTIMRLVFADIAGIPAYHFDIQTFWFTLALFLITYELILFLYARRMRHLSLKSIMLE